MKVLLDILIFIDKSIFFDYYRNLKVISKPDLSKVNF